MRCMTAICPAGPPNESAATRNQTQNASPQLTPWDGSALIGTVVAAAVSAIKFSSAALLAEGLVEVVEHGAAARDPLVVLAIGRADPGNQGANAGRLLAPDLLILEVDVVHDLADGAQRRVAEAGAAQQDLERAAVALVRELGFEHVEAQLAGLRHIAFGRHELEVGLRVDKAADQPRGGDPVDVNARTGDPRAPVKIGQSHRSPLLLLRDLRLCDSFFAQPLLQAREQAIDCIAPVRPEKVDRDHVILAGLEALKLRLALDALLSEGKRIEREGKRPRLFGEFFVVRVARAPEQFFDLLVRETSDELGLADQPLPALVLNFLQEPLEILLGLLARRQRVDRVLDRHGADALQAAPDLHPGVGRLGGQLIAQQQPGLGRGNGAILVPAHPAHVSAGNKKRNTCIFNASEIIMLITPGRMRWRYPI